MGHARQFPGYVEQEVQFRFDNGVWNCHSRKRGVELTIEGSTPFKRKTTMNNHYNGTFAEPWGERSQRGYGIESSSGLSARRRTSNTAGPPVSATNDSARCSGLATTTWRPDRQTVAAVQAMEAILAKHAEGTPNCVVEVDSLSGGLVLLVPGKNERHVLYEGRVSE